MSDIIHIEPDKKQTPRKAGVNLSVFQYPYLWNSWQGFWGNIAYFPKCLRAAWQRATRGYCDRDIYSCGDSIVDYLIATITDYRNKTYSWPDRYFKTFEEWINYLDEILELLEYSIQDPDTLNEWFEQYSSFMCKGTKEWTADERVIFDKFYKAEEEISKELKEARREALERLTPYLGELWW